MGARNVFAEPAEGTAFFDLVGELIGFPLGDGSGHTTKTFAVMTEAWEEGFRQIRFPDSFPDSWRGLIFASVWLSIVKNGPMSANVASPVGGRPSLPCPHCLLAAAQVEIERELAPGLSDLKYASRAAEALNFGATRRRNKTSNPLAADHILRAKKRGWDCVYSWPVDEKRFPDPTTELAITESLILGHRALLEIVHDVWGFWRDRPDNLKPKRFKGLCPAEERIPLPKPRD